MQTQSVRAIIAIGKFEFKTPYVKSFNVTRQRGSIWASATASIEMPKDQPVDFAGGGITITVIVDGESKLLFTGYVDKIDVTPSQSRYSSTMVSLTAYDILYRLRNLKVNRRLQLAADKLWCAITSLVRRNDNLDANLIKKPDHSVILNVDYMGIYNPFENLSTTSRSLSSDQLQDISSGDTTVGNKSTVLPHTHESYSQGGPAVGVFGDYKLYTDQ